MDLRTRTTLLCAAFAIAITVSILLRSRKRKVHYLLSAFAADMALWYLAQWLLRFFQAEIWFRATAVLAVLLPQFALHLFASIAPASGERPNRLLRVGAILGVPFLALAISKFQARPAARAAIFVYVFGLVAAGLVDLAAQALRNPSRAVKERLRLLVAVGSFALILSIGDFTWFIGAEIPPVGAVLSVVFLFALSESMQRERLVDLYELIGRLMVFTALAFCLAGIFYAFVTYVGFETMYLNATLAAIAILLLFEPLRTMVEEKIHAIFFRQRRELETAVRDAQRRLVHVLQIEEMGEAVMAVLQRTRRFTDVALYLLDADGTELSLRHSFGEGAPARIEVATARPLIERLRKSSSVVLETVSRDRDEARMRGDATTEFDGVMAASKVLGRLDRAVVLGVRAEGDEVVGLLVLQDERARDAFSADEVGLLEGLTPFISVVIENSRAYSRMKERDRLAALGQMAAGLAHEIKNPLGSIKGAAQFLLEGGPEAGGVPQASRDFLDIIIEEVDRLDRVVGSVLDYARPRQGNPAPVDVNGVVRRTMQILTHGVSSAIVVDMALEEGMPAVSIDAEHLRQVLMNLVHNGMQAIGSEGNLTIATRFRRQHVRGSGEGGGAAGAKGYVEISVKDTGHGISPKILNNLFVPFFSTKTKGTGLGLAVSQRIVQAAGGSIEVATQEGSGSTFTVVLPTAELPAGALEAGSARPQSQTP